MLLQNLHFQHQVGGRHVLEFTESWTIWVLDALYGRTAEQIASAVDMLLNHKDPTLQDSDAVTLALESFRRRPAVGFSDCLVVEIARNAGHVPLGTFDRDLAKLGGTERLR